MSGVEFFLVMKKLHMIGKKINKLAANMEERMSQLDDRIIAMNTRLDEATTEILDLLHRLEDESLSEAGQAALAQAETKVAALADIVPGPTTG